MTMINATRSRMLTLLAGAAVLCTTLATTAVLDSADARGRSYHGGHGHRAGAFDHARFHHQRGHYYGKTYRSHYGFRYHNRFRPYAVQSGRGVVGGGHHYEGY
jgi:hypothetical protein